MSISRLVLSSITCVLLAGLGLGQSLSFNSSTVSAGPVSGTPNPEGWSSDGGTVTVVPFGPLAAPVAGLPGEGDQWCVVSAEGATGGLASPAGGPAPHPFAVGDTGHLRVPLPIPGPPGGRVVISFDWTYVSLECGSDPTYNDFFTVDLVDASGNVLQNLLYRDTFSAGLTPGGAVTPDHTGAIPVGYCPASEEAPLGVVKTANVLVDLSLHANSNAVLEFRVGNGADAGYSSYAHVDNIVVSNVRYPGSLDDFELLTGVDSPANAVDINPLVGGEHLTMEFNSPNGTFDNALLLVFLQQYPNGAFPGPTPGFPEVQVNLFQPYFAITGLPGAPFGNITLPPGGFTLSATTSASPTLSGSSFMLQGVVVSAASSTGFATTNGHEFAYAPRVYVSATTGAPGNPGTASAPLSTIADGYFLATSLGASEMWVAEGVYNESSFIIDVPMTIRGGFDANTWTHTNTTNSVVWFPPEGLRFVTIPLVGLGCSSVVSGFDFYSAHATQFGAPSIAVRLDYCDGITFEDCKFQAGYGGPGSPSAAGTVGAVGSPGGGGEDGEDLSWGSAACGFPWEGCTDGGGGGPGANPGGTGGFGGARWNDMGHNGQGGSAGGGASGGSGGAHGQGSGTWNAYYASCCSILQLNGGPGNTPSVAGPGSEGIGGASPGVPGGAIYANNGNWHALLQATAGGAGAGGSGGGGGGGGGATSDGSGGAGGGGGGGGYGGQEGQGGGEGGASFALYLFHSSPTFTSCYFSSASGGDGGDGGSGGPGGAGGPGGPGGAAASICSLFGSCYPTGAGGAGGHGGQGGGGGGGGGGHGGPSYCVFQVGSNPVGLTDPSNTFQPGPGGIPGSGGLSGNLSMPAADGQWGPTGITN